MRGQIGGLFQSYKLRGISRYVSRYGPPYRGIPRYGNSSRYPPLEKNTFHPKVVFQTVHHLADREDQSRHREASRFYIDDCQQCRCTYEAGMAQLVARSTVSRCVVSSSPSGAEHFGFPPSAP